MDLKELRSEIDKIDDELVRLFGARMEIAAKIAAPLTKVEEIVVLSGDNSKVTSEVNRLLAELPASVHALTGVDLSKVGVSLSAVGCLGRVVGALKPRPHGISHPCRYR